MATAPTPAPGPSSITCSCPVCGPLTLRASCFLLVKCDWNADRSFYWFTCPKCEENVIKQASARVVTGLSTRGVHTIAFPAEALEIAEHTGPALTTDDLLDLACALADDATVAAAIAKVSPAPEPTTEEPAP